jgi:hypothetical protein
MDADTMLSAPILTAAAKARHLSVYQASEVLTKGSQQQSHRKARG